MEFRGRGKKSLPFGRKNEHLLLRVEGGVENRAGGREEAREVKGKSPWFSSEVGEAGT